MWRDVGRALDPVRFDPRHPERHSSRAYREGLDWERLRRSVLAVPGYEREPVLLARLAEAEWRLRNRTKAIESWFALRRLAPEEFERMIEARGFPDWALRSAWRVALEQEPESEMTPSWFPAWMLLSHPGSDERSIELRRTLQAIHPGLLARYLEKRIRTSPHPPSPG